MKQLPSLILALWFSCLLPAPAFAEAPVVDDSENFAILDDQQAAAERPVANGRYDDSNAEEEIALAQDNGEIGDNASNMSVAAKVQSMQQEIRELRGLLEVQDHQLKLLQQQQLSFYKDIDARLNSAATAKNTSTPQPTQLDIGGTPPAPAAALQRPGLPPSASRSFTAPVIPAGTGRNNPADEQISYMSAYDLVKNKRYDDALIAMQNFVSQYPNGGYTANAQYWLGELYMVKRNYPEAISHFETVLKQFPASSKAAACTLKIGYAQAASGRKAEARHSLEQVINNYPDTPTAQLAATKLKSISAS
ncbi:tol-pal system protein YbgF [Legionella dresdenensis]|uniref:Cell division coordinator CpoB n=1 Tax=Legionella dresdenensis TaxID=450200 RepID=A0ABV8CD51_9GAMM